MSTTSARKTAEVTYDYQAEADNQLSIKKGDVITVVGTATAENWILAINKNGKQGYIPNEYFKIISASRSSASRPAPPPPSYVKYATEPVDDMNTTDSTAGTGFTTLGANATSSKSQSGGSGFLGREDTYSLFAYQLEWYSVSLGFLGALFSLLYGTVEPPPQGPIMWTAGILGIIFDACLMVMLAYNREMFNGAWGRGALFITLGCLLIAGYPVSIGVGILCIYCGIFNIYYIHHKYKCKPIPNIYQENWCANMLGGMEYCTANKLTAFFLWLAFDFFIFAWGFVNGYEHAINITDNTQTNYYINPKTYGVALGFGRIVTINLFLLFIYSCYGCLDRRTAALQASRRQDTCCGKCHIFIAEKERRQYIHRILAYPIVWASILHMIVNFFAYEDSGSTRSFRFAFGYETIITGNILMFILGIIVASSNDKIRDYNPELFRNTHLLSLLFSILIIVHGTNGTNTNTCIAFIASGIGIYLIDLLLRCGGK